MVEVSIIVPIYNTEKYLRKCIDSLLNQNIDMSDDFSYMNIIIPDKQDQSVNNLNNYYNLYYYTLSQPIISDLSFKLYFRKAED